MTMLIQSKKWKGTILITCVIFIVILFCEIYPRGAGVFGIFVDWTEKEERIATLQYKKNELTEIYIENKLLNRRINSIVTEYSEHNKLSGIISTVGSIANKTNCKISSITPLGIRKEQNLWVQSIEIRLLSGYESIYNFVRFLENSRKVILMKQLSISLTENKKLEITAIMEVYLNI